MTKAQLLARIATLEREVKLQDRGWKAEKESLLLEIGREQNMRVSAQRGLVPYVRSLEQFDKWLLQNPALRKELEPILRELGLWEIKLGYDPAKDLTLSVVSPQNIRNRGGNFTLGTGKTSGEGAKTIVTVFDGDNPA